MSVLPLHFSLGCEFYIEEFKEFKPLYRPSAIYTLRTEIQGRENQSGDCVEEVHIKGKFIRLFKMQVF